MICYYLIKLYGVRGKKERPKSKPTAWCKQCTNAACTQCSVLNVWKVYGVQGKREMPKLKSKAWCMQCTIFAYTQLIVLRICEDLLQVYRVQGKRDTQIQMQGLVYAMQRHCLYTAYSVHDM